jgi:hypothetical protein
MKILKSILYALGLILVITLTGIYFLPDSYSVTQTVEISRSKETVYKMVSDYNNWKTWSPWVEMDPELAITVEGEPGKAGHKMSWKGSKLGRGYVK